MNLGKGCRPLSMRNAAGFNTPPFFSILKPRAGFYLLAQDEERFIGSHFKLGSRSYALLVSQVR
jgi:hypothetical protein